MEVPENFKSIASLIGEPVRALMLWNLLDGRALTATELAVGADVSLQSASMHLNKLVRAELLSVESQGRHRYYRFSKPEVAYVIEAIANLVPQDKISSNKGLTNDVNTGIKYCRTCYDHLAGKVGVALTDQFLKQKILMITHKQYDTTPKGFQWFRRMNIDVEVLKAERRVFARQCLDWSERRHHLAGGLGAALLTQMFRLGWLKKMKSSRAILLTEKGQTALYKELGLSL